jgi:hypothetical protein
MKKFRVLVEERTIYAVEIKAKKEKDAKDLALESPELWESVGGEVFIYDVSELTKGE